MGFHVLRAPPLSSSTATSSASILFKFGYALYSSPFSKSSSSSRIYFRASAKYVGSTATPIPGSLSRRTRGFIAATAAPGSLRKSEELRPSISPEQSWVQRQTGTESLPASEVPLRGRIYHETYGCQMNINDMEVVLSIMKSAGYSETVDIPETAEIIFINTCAIRDNAEQKVWQRLNYFWFLKRHWKSNVATGRSQSRHPPKVVVLGCMAERLKDKILDADKMVDVVCGPDAYRDLPRLLDEVDYGQKGINTLLSLEETYADISPVRISKNSVTAFVSVMRGCNNMCSFCIVPFTRGRERSRPVESIVCEVRELYREGVKEVTLLGQNVNSYNDTTENADVEPGTDWKLSDGFSTIAKVKKMGLRFSDLLDRLSTEFPEMRFRYTSPHPKDFPDEFLYLMRDRHNICKSIHLPAQSGNSTVLERMRRGYTREAYLDLVHKIRSIIPDVGITSDFICGFCGESEEEHADTLSLVSEVGYDMAYMFAYSMREKTHAHRNYVDDVPEEVKQRRLSELIETFRNSTGRCYDSQIGSVQLVLVEGANKRALYNSIKSIFVSIHCIVFVYTHTHTHTHKMATLTVPDQLPPVAEDCERLHNAFQGWGTDEGAIISILAHRNAKQRSLIRQTYTETYGEDLLKSLDKELSSDFERVVLLWTLQPAERDALLANESIRKLTPKHFVILEIACTRTPRDLFLVKEEYHARFKRSIEEDVAQHTTGDFRRLLVPLVTAYRYDGPEVNATLATSEAKILHEKISEKAYNDEELIRIISTRSKAQLNATFNHYNDQFGNAINKDLKTDPDNEYLKLLRSAIKCLTWPEKYFEKVLRLAIKGLGTDEEALTRVVVTRAEVDMKRIVEEYYRRSSVPLDQAIKGDTSGDYEGMLLALIGNGSG